jgi:hypothetical protein
MPIRYIAPFLALLAAAPVMAQTVDPASDLGKFRQYRDSGMQALDWKDPNAAFANFQRAQSLIPDSPSILLLEAQTALKANKRDIATAALTDYLDRGYLVDLKQNTEFRTLWNDDLAKQQAANTAVVGDLHVAASLPGFTIPNALAYDPQTQSLYVATVRNGKIIALDPKGGHDVLTFRPGVAAYGLALRDGLLWAATAATRQTEGYDPKKPAASKIVTIDPKDGAVKTIATGADDAQFGHLLAGRDDLYVIDSNHGAVLRLNGYAGDLQTLIPEGYMDSPQGLAENAEASVLIVADFISGLYRIDLNSGEMTHLKAPDGVSLLGLTSLSVHGGDLVAVQNGFKPNKVLQLHLSPDWSAVTGADVVARDDSQLSQPAQGVVDGDHFIFVSRSQWDNLDPGGAALNPKPEPAAISAVSLPASEKPEEKQPSE